MTQDELNTLIYEQAPLLGENVKSFMNLLQVKDHVKSNPYDALYIFGKYIDQVNALKSLSVGQIVELLNQVYSTSLK